jgi:hypothetical protein
MSGSVVTIGGGLGSLTGGIVSVASSLPSTVSDLLQSYLASVATISGSGFQNYDAATGAIYSTPGSGAAVLGVISNTDSTGSSVPGIANPNILVPTAVTTLLVQAPGDMTVIGSSNTTMVELGATSNVDYSVTDGQGSIFAAGGSNNINVYSTSQESNLDITSAGNDTVNLIGRGSDSVNAAGNATTTVFVGAGTATVTASNSSTATIIFTQNAGGNLDFINGSTAAQTVYSGSYTTAGGQNVYAPNSVTAFGGAGGGFYVGGRAGNNSLVGGTGTVTLVGGGSGDVLEANASVTGSINKLFSGQGAETLLGSSTSGSNAFNLGMQYVGIGDVTASGVASTEGSGTQYFTIGATNGETVTGSNMPNANNIYDIVGDSTTGGSTLTITNFNPANSVIFLTDNTTQGPSDASVSVIGSSLGGDAQILLTDGTTITLKGVAEASLQTATLSGGVIGIN